MHGGERAAADAALERRARLVGGEAERDRRAARLPGRPGRDRRLRRVLRALAREHADVHLAEVGEMPASGAGEPAALNATHVPSALIEGLCGAPRAVRRPRRPRGRRGPRPGSPSVGRRRWLRPAGTPRFAALEVNVTIEPSGVMPPGVVKPSAAAPAASGGHELRRAGGEVAGQHLELGARRQAEGRGVAREQDHAPVPADHRGDRRRLRARRPVRAGGQTGRPRVQIAHVDVRVACRRRRRRGSTSSTGTRRAGRRR